MTATPRKPESERSLTDESLRTERDNSDRAIAESNSSLEDDADAVVQRARHNADAVLGEAREKADEQLAQRGGRASSIGRVTRARASADEVLCDERAAEDDVIRRERDEQARILRGLLPLERAKTDRHLLSERVRSDDALASRDDFLSIVSHDLRSLLSGIVMSAFLLSSEGADPADGDSGIRTNTDRIRRYAARMNRLIGDLEDVGSIDAGRLAIEPTRGDLTPVVTEALETFRDAAAAQGVSLTTEHLEGPLMADFDDGRILQVLANLIANALKFTAPGGTIRLRCEAVGESIRFSLRDTGIGIPEDMLATVFERFRQVGKNDRRGLGLGLYTSAGIVHAHGGEIWAESQLGEGSVFCFTLPAATPAPGPLNP